MKGETLTVEITPFSVTGNVSGSGKSTVHASTRGNVRTDLQVEGKDLIIGLNAYTKL